MKAGRRNPWRTYAIIGLVGAVHLGLFELSSRREPLPPLPEVPVISVELFTPRPPPVVPPPPPPPPTPAPVVGGGAPAAPSRVRPALLPPPRPVEITAPPVPAPKPALVVGVAPVESATPGAGQGGTGTGTGTGTGSGAGPGSGSTPPRFVRGPTQGDLRSIHPPEALRAGLSGEAVVRCVIREDQYLHRCTIVSARPGGRGFEEAGLLAARFYRFRPPTRDGVALTDQPVTITVQFGRPMGRGN